MSISGKNNIKKIIESSGKEFITKQIQITRGGLGKKSFQKKKNLLKECLTNTREKQGHSVK